ncbi:hsdS protein [Lacticaseibacillus paracasei subsp. tolerans DSM 20258]|nr:hsdS protein [Lacticaseibacillus paracasei subsp. tolerans DSM 20258]
MTSQNRRPTMSANQTKYPQLRFKGFTDPWEKRTLGQTTAKAKSYSLSRDVERDHETGYRYIHYGDIHTGVADIVTEHTKLPNIEPANYDELRVNDLVVADASEDYRGIAEPAVVVGLPTQHLVAGLHTITLRPSSASSLYLYYLLHTDSFKHFGYQMGTGLKVFGISWSNLSKFTFMIPSRPEQEMIVKLIESVDNLIAVNQRKLAKLKELKQVYLQKMFPKNGSKFPQLRFSGFADAWEQRKLSEIYDKIRNAFVGTATPYYVNQGHFYLESNNVKYGKLNFNNEVYINDDFYQKQKPNWLHTGDLVVVQSGHVGHSAVIPSELNNTAAHAVIIVAKPKQKIDPYFINDYLQTNIARKQIDNITTGNTIKHILTSAMKMFEVSLPSYEEQRPISNLLAQIDDTITLHQRKLEKLQELKKGYLQKMFC